MVNKMIVFVCTGIWHGASFNFLFWGIYHGFFLMLEEYIPFIGKKGGKLKSFFSACLCTSGSLCWLCVFPCGHYEAGMLLDQRNVYGFWMEGFRNEPYTAAADTGISCNSGSGTGRSSSGKQHAEKYKWYEGFTYVLSLAGFALCVLSLAGGTYNPFIYFRF